MITKFKIFENKLKCKYTSDEIRLNIIKQHISDFKQEEDYNIEEPNYDDLVDDWDGYSDQIYIQNDLENNKIIYYEGWVQSCWDGLYIKDEYKGLSKKESIEKLINDRFSIVAKLLNLKIIDYTYWLHRGEYDGYIMKIDLKLN